MKIFFNILFFVFSSLLSQQYPINLTGLCLTYNDIALFTSRENECSKKLKHSPSLEIIKLQNQELYTYIRSNCLWHQKIPSCGMQADYNSSYVPYRFSLWELAPKKGKGSCVVLLDTGVAAFEYAGVKKHPDIEYTHFNPFINYNCCFTGLQDFMAYYTTFLKPGIVCQETDIIPCIVEYCSSGKTDLLCASLKKFGQKKIFDEQQNITAYGKEVIACLTTGRRGIKPYGTTRFFSAVALTYPKNYATLCELLPQVSYKGIDKKGYCIASHGTHLYGLINASSSRTHGIYGVAPHAQTIMLSVGDEISNAQTMFLALKKARGFNPDIINISLKFEQSWHNDIGDLIQQELKNFDYVIAASGNAWQSEHAASLPFPAICPQVISIGAYSFDGKRYTICPFSHYEKNKGPHFVLPGFNILSTSIPTHDEEYLFLSGTSMATALASGFFALMLAEFKDCFSRKQLISACFYSAKRLDSDQAWYEKTMFGALDMKTALFFLHVCKRLKEKKCFVKEKFDTYLNATSFILQFLMNNHVAYKLSNNLDGMVNFVVDFINKAMSTLKYNDNLINQLRLILA